jgi:hypothetical protein
MWARLRRKFPAIWRGILRSSTGFVGNALVAAAVLALALPTRPALAREGGLPREHHPWGRFAPGSWKLVRVVTETLDPKGEVTTTSTTETRTTLEGRSDSTVKLLINTSVEVTGKKVDATPQTIVLGFHGEPADQPVTVKDLGPDKVTIEGREIACRVQQVETTADGARTTAKTWYSDSVAPYMLRRESVSTEAETGKPLSETKVKIVDLDAQCTVLSVKRRAVKLEVTNKHAKGHTVTQVWSSMDVPGGVIAHTSDEFDATGKLVRRSRLELVDFGVK